ncbi:MAG: hypothetical protein H0U81_08545 [Pyrinomonadaceae bacterium]|nr:hypothetical protein [Pyrinomonadaceae bacterium]
MCIMLAALAPACRQSAESFEGYFAPVYSPDGQYVYFIERRTSGTVSGPGAGFFTPPADVFISKDEFLLKRINVAGGTIEELKRMPRSPAEGQHFQAYHGSIFATVDARLEFTENGQLKFKVCLSIPRSPRSEGYSMSGTWDGTLSDSGGVDGSWERSHCQISGYDEWRLSGDWEVMEARGREFFPAAVVAYNRATRAVKVLIKNQDYDRLYPNGITLQQIQESSQREGIERTLTIRRVHDELLRKYKAMGLSEVQALLRTGEEMERLGYYPRTTKIVARPLERGEAAKAKHNRAAIFVISKDEMQTGIFHDIEQAISRPGVEIRKGFGEYPTHIHYFNSARLNAFLKSGKTQFYVRYLGETYELTIR